MAVARKRPLPGGDGADKRKASITAINAFSPVNFHATLNQYSVLKGILYKCV